ncbi:MAG: transcriptional repressor LexA [Clostridium sp.]|nr:transcriptional repressor LexA [Clostridium sp.]
MKKLDNPQQAIYEYIQAYYKENGFPPSVREIGQAVGLRSTATVHTHLKKMEQKGMLTRDPSKQRALILTQQDEEEPAAKVAASAAVDAQKIPLIGKVAAGVPILAVEQIEDNIAVPSVLLHGRFGDETYLLRVQGDSMVNAGIHDGDLLLVDRSIRFEDGDIVVARTEEETVTVKRIYREKDGVRLQPENELYAPIFVPYDKVEIAGKVIGLMRRF